MLKRRRRNMNKLKDKKSNYDSTRLSISNRKDRYLIAISMISVILIICNVSYRIFLKDINNIYLTNSLKPYLRPEQVFGTMLAILCISLLFRLIAYSFSEAKTIVNYNLTEKATEERLKMIDKTKKTREERADILYESIFVFLKHYIIFTILFVIVGIMFKPDLPIISSLYNLNFIIPSIIALIIGGVIACLYSIYEIDMSSKELESTYKKKIINETIIVSIIIILVYATSIIKSDMTGKINLSFSNGELDVKLESNNVFENLIINIQNYKFDESINLQLNNEDLYFSSTSFTKKLTNEINNKNTDLEYIMNMGDYLLYYDNTIDYSKYLVNGKNKVTIFITLGDSTYRIVNYVDKDNYEYIYLRESYQKVL